MQGFLGALAPEDATEQIFPAAQVRDEAGHNEPARDVILSAARSEQLVDTFGRPAYIPGTEECSAAQGSGQSGDVKLAQTASGLALTGLRAGTALAVPGITAVGTAIAPFTFGISAVAGLFPVLFGHHAQAVKREQSVMCAAVPAANNYLRIIDEAVQSGQIDPQQGIDALNSLLSDFSSQVSSIQKGSSPGAGGACNAACIMAAQLRAIVLERSSEYQDLLDGAAQTVTPSRPNVVRPAGVSAPSSYASFYAGRGTPAGQPDSGSWLPVAAVALAAFFLLRSV